MADVYEIVVKVRKDVECMSSENEDVNEVGQDLDWDFTKRHEQKIRKWDALQHIHEDLWKHYLDKTTRMQELYAEQQEWTGEDCVIWPSDWEVELVIKLVHGKITNVIWKDEGSLVEVLDWLDEKVQQH